MSGVLQDHSEGARTARCRRWVGTENNPAADERQLPAGCRTLVWQREAGGEEGTPHHQLMIIYDKAVGFNKVKGDFPRAWLAPMKGTVQQAYAYCTKDDTRIAGPWELGQKVSGQGARNDILAMVAAVKRGATDAELLDEMPAVFVRQYRGIDRVRFTLSKPRDFMTLVMVYWGPPGSGKTHAARAVGGEQYWLTLGTRGKSTWWDGYQGEETVVIDEFFGQESRDAMCRLVDKYPLKLQVKGGFINFSSRRIIITSNVHPKQWWKSIHLGPFARRLGLNVDGSGESEKVVYLPDRWLGEGEAPADFAPRWATPEEYMQSDFYQTNFGMSSVPSYGAPVGAAQ